MSVPPPAGAAAGSGARERVLTLEGRRRRRGDEVLRLSALGAVLEHEGLVRPLKLPLGTLQLGLVERGAAKAGRDEGRFPVLRRIGARSVIPREEGVEGWLWTSTGGSALTMLGNAGEAPNAALLFTKPLGEDVVTASFAPGLVEEIAARSPLGAPAVYGLLLRVAEPTLAEATFKQFSLLRPLTDREVPPTLRRSLPTDRSPDPRVRLDAQTDAASSVAPPGPGWTATVRGDEQPAGPGAPRPDSLHGVPGHGARALGARR
jgi:hypothetical protein